VRFSSQLTDVNAGLPGIARLLENQGYLIHRKNFHPCVGRCTRDGTEPSRLPCLKDTNSGGSGLVKNLEKTYLYIRYVGILGKCKERMKGACYLRGVSFVWYWPGGLYCYASPCKPITLRINKEDGVFQKGLRSFIFGFGMDSRWGLSTSSNKVSTTVFTIMAYKCKPITS